MFMRRIAYCMHIGRTLHRLLRLLMKFLNGTDAEKASVIVKKIKVVSVKILEKAGLL